MNLVFLSDWHVDGHGKTCRFWHLGAMMNARAVSISEATTEASGPPFSWVTCGPNNEPGASGEATSVEAAKAAAMASLSEWTAAL